MVDVRGIVHQHVDGPWEHKVNDERDEWVIFIAAVSSFHQEWLDVTVDQHRQSHIVISYLFVSCHKCGEQLNDVFVLLVWLESVENYFLAKSLHLGHHVLLIPVSHNFEQVRNHLNYGEAVFRVVAKSLHNHCFLLLHEN